MKLSIVIPAYNEEGLIAKTLQKIADELRAEAIDYELVVVNDNSKDNTLGELKEFKKFHPELTIYTNPGPNGFGYAVRYGLERYRGDCVAVMMADLSDSPQDLIEYYNKLNEGYDCVFGSRFIKGGKTIDYPRVKWVINRIANFLIRVAFRIRLNDTTNAFKIYTREAMEGLKPFLAPHFNLTIELPLKAIVRGYSYAIVPITWQNRAMGKSNLKIREMGSRYFFIMLYCLIEKYFSLGDFRKDRTGLKSRAKSENDVLIEKQQV